MKRLPRCVRGLITAIAAFTTVTPPGLTGQNATPLARIQNLDLDTTQVGRVLAYFAAPDRQFAVGLGALSESAAAHFEQEFGSAFGLHLAVLRPEPWFVPYQGGDLEPYGMPWGWVPESLMTVPASLTEGVLIQGPTEAADVRRIRFVMLHEFGHLAAKHYLHPQSGQPHSAVRWFEELVATYFAYGFVREYDRGWATAAHREWLTFVATNAPASPSLDWSLMFQLPAEQFAATYAWYQNLLNLRAAELYAEHGLDFLHDLRDRLDWHDSANWTTESLVPRLDEFAPGFRAWAAGVESGAYADQPAR